MPVPTLEYLFAIKCMAMRSASKEAQRDIANIKALAQLASIEDIESASAIVESFYLSHLMRCGIEEIMQPLADGS